MTLHIQITIYHHCIIHRVATLAPRVLCFPNQTFTTLTVGVHLSICTAIAGFMMASIVVTTNFTSRRLASITTTASVYWRARRAELCVAHNAVASHIAARANNNTTVHSNTGEAAKMFTLHIYNICIVTMREIYYVQNNCEMCTYTKKQ